MLFIKRCNFHICLISLVFILFNAIPSAAFADEAEAIWEKGEKAFEAGRYKDAAGYYEKSLNICRPISHLECISGNLNGLGRAYEAMGDDGRALDYYEESLKINRALNSKSEIATSLLNAGAIKYVTFERHKEALTYMRESHDLYMETGDQEGVAIAAFHMGSIKTVLGDYDGAVRDLQESININKRLNNEAGIAGCLTNMGYALYLAGKYDTALAKLEEALALQKRLDMPGEIASTLNRIGLVHHDSARPDKALYYYEEALRLARSNSDKKMTATALNNIGTLYNELGKYEPALNYYKDALAMNRELNRRGNIATVLNNIGNTHVALGKYDGALGYYNESLRLNKELGREAEVALNLNNIAMLYYNLQDYEAAIRHHKETIGIRKKLNLPLQLAQSLDNLGSAYLFGKRYKEAEETFLERRKMRSGITGTSIRLRHAGLAETYLMTGRHDEALALIDEIPPKPKEGAPFLMQYHGQRGRALMAKGMIKDASLEFYKAVSISEDMRGDISERTGFMAAGSGGGRIRAYRGLVASLAERALRGEKSDPSLGAMGSDMASSAFYYAEMVKARALLESIAGGLNKSAGGIPDDLRRKEREIMEGFIAMESQWEKAYAKGDAAIRELSEKKDALKLKLDSLIAKLKKDHPLYASLKYPSPAMPNDVPLRDNEVLIDYALAENACYAFVLRPGGSMRIVKIPITRDEVESRVKSFIAPLAERKYDGFSTKEAKALYEILLMDALRDVGQSERVIIAPDGILGLLPFGALVISEGKGVSDGVYVADRFSITYTQSASVTALARMIMSSDAPRLLMAVGNPIYSADDPRHGGGPAVKSDAKFAFRALALKKQWGKTTSQSDDTGGMIEFPPLPETETEVREVARVMNVAVESPGVLLNADASETKFKGANPGDYKIIHMATHASLPGMAQGINEPFILLGQVGNKTPDDGFLTLSEALDLRLRADMVVLSACVTGVGREIEGEGVANFARAFQHGGAKSVVVSLWEVASSPAVEYMKIFYGHIKSGKTRSEAMHMAQKEMKSKYPNPFFWAVFVLYGEG